MPYGDGTATALTEISIGEERIAYIGSGILADARAKDMAEGLISSADVLVLGKCGKKYSKPLILDTISDVASEFILSGKGIYLTQEARVHLDERGTRFYLRPKWVELIP